MALDILPNCDMLMGKTHIHYYNILNFWFSTCHLRQWMCWNTLDLDYTINYFRYFKKYEICLYTYKPNHSVHDFFFNQWICSRVNTLFPWNLKLTSNALLSMQCSSLIRFKVMSMAIGYHIIECCLMYTFEVYSVLNIF